MEQLSTALVKLWGDLPCPHMGWWGGGVVLLFEFHSFVILSIASIPLLNDFRFLSLL